MPQQPFVFLFFLSAGLRPEFCARPALPAQLWASFLMFDLHRNVPETAVLQKKKSAAQAAHTMFYFVRVRIFASVWFGALDRGGNAENVEIANQFEI